MPNEYEAPAAEEPAVDRPSWLSTGASDEQPEATIAEGSEEEAPPAPKMKLGGTLFERMQAVARGGSRNEEEEGGSDSLDIPRFLHRQNNQ